LQSGSLADYFGMTKDPTSCYMLVMRYYENGNLYSYLDESMGVLCWRDIVDMLWAISAGLNFIHERDLVHGHLHGGNILVENEMDSIDTKIADTVLLTNKYLLNKFTELYLSLLPKSLMDMQ
jgi:serine/threonine protein kinase